ncbi:MAG: TraB/GumN family protein, partial [Flavobacteriales bacterium]
MSEMKNVRISSRLTSLVLLLLLFSALGSLAQSYQSLMWRISGNGLRKDSYLYGTMHVSGRTVFHLGDPFYDAMQNSDVVALELEPEMWLHDMMAKPEESYNWMEVDYSDYYDSDMGEYALEGKFLFRYDVLGTMQQALSVSPPLLNYMLFRYNEFESTSDFEEDTWLDMHIYQCGKKMGKETIGLETFD